MSEESKKEFYDYVKTVCNLSEKFLEQTKYWEARKAFTEQAELGEIRINFLNNPIFYSVPRSWKPTSTKDWAGAYITGDKSLRDLLKARLKFL